jgi:MFS family permease
MQISSYAANARMWQLAITNLLSRIGASYAANARMWQLAIVLAAVYFAEGLAQQAGLIGQPLRLYLNDTLKLTTTQISLLGWVWYIPVLVKPGLGIITDYMPIFGSRRKLYLILANAVTTVGYLYMIGAASWVTVSIAMFITNGGLIMATAVTGGLLVENGKQSGLSSRFVSLQWLFFSLALILASYIAGGLTEHYKDTPLVALHITAGLSAAAALGMLAVCWYFLDEEKTTAAPDWKLVKQAIKAGVVEVAQTRAIWIAALFIFAYFFSPGLGNPLYLYQMRELHFDQNFIGELGSLGAASSIVGGLLFLVMARWMNLRQLLYFSIVTGTISGLSMLWLLGETSAIVITVSGGIIGMVALITALSLAAEFCPAGSESFTYAVLMSCHNVCNPLSELTGGLLYDHVFYDPGLPIFHALIPLIWISSAFTLLPIVIVPFLKFGNKPAKK